LPVASLAPASLARLRGGHRPILCLDDSAGYAVALLLVRILVRLVIPIAAALRYATAPEAVSPCDAAIH
jgi:hypothetical protein